MSDINEILKKSTVFESLDEDSLGRLGDLFDSWEIHPGDTLTTAGDTAHTFFLLEKGTLLLAMDEDKAIVLNQSGDFAGLELLSAKGIYKTTLSVLEKGRVMAVPRDKFLDIIQENSSAAEIIMSAWQEYIEAKAPFAKNNEDVDLPIQF